MQIDEKIYLIFNFYNMAIKFERTKTHVNIGTIGHVDHGKTTLTAALSKYSSDKGFGSSVAFDKIDKAPEEKDRGITINSTTIEYCSEKRHYSHTDCPGHKDYIKNMITGAANLDIAIIVVACTDGAMHQTREHLLLIRQLGLLPNNLAIFLNKEDMVEGTPEEKNDLVDLVKMEISELADKYGFEKVEFVTGSALAALQYDPAKDKGTEKEKYYNKIGDLFEIIDAMELPPRQIDKPFCMCIEGVHMIKGRGIVVTGKIEQGQVKIGDQIDVVTQRNGVYQTTVTGVEMFKKILDQGQAGDNVGLLLRGVVKGKVNRGDLLCAKGTIKPYSKFVAEVYVLTPEEGGRKSPINVGYRPQFYLKTTDVTGSIQRMQKNDGGNMEEKEITMPGDNVTLDIELIHEIGLSEGQLFTMREGGQTIGKGRITKIIA